MNFSKVIRKIIEDDRIIIQYKYRNGRVGSIVIRRFVPAILFGYAIGLYAGEGTKRPKTVKTRFEFVNSDPNKLLAMVKFLEILGVTRSAIKPRLQIKLAKWERDEVVQKLERYWSNLLNIPLSQFRKSVVRRGSRTSRSNFGTLSIRVYNSFLLDLFTFWERTALLPLLESPPPEGHGFPGNASSAGSKPVLRPTLTG